MSSALTLQSSTNLTVASLSTTLFDAVENPPSPRAALSRDLARGILSGATRRGLRQVLRSDHNSHERWQGIVREPGTCPQVVLAALQESMTAYAHLDAAYLALAENFRPSTVQVAQLSLALADYRTATAQTHAVLLEREAWLLNYADSFAVPMENITPASGSYARRYARLQRQVRSSHQEQQRSRAAFVIWNSMAALDAALVAVELASASTQEQEDEA